MQNISSSIHVTGGNANLLQQTVGKNIGKYFSNLQFFNFKVVLNLFQAFFT
jgi:hypothetical protein